MDRDEVIKIVRGLPWPSEIAVNCVDAVIKGEIMGFVNARAAGDPTLNDWEPAAVQLIDPYVIYMDGSTRRGSGASIPFDRIISIGVP